MYCRRMCAAGQCAQLSHSAWVSAWSFPTLGMAMGSLLLRNMSRSTSENWLSPHRGLNRPVPLLASASGMLLMLLQGSLLQHWLLTHGC